MGFFREFGRFVSGGPTGGASCKPTNGNSLLQGLRKLEKLEKANPGSATAEIALMKARITNHEREMRGEDHLPLPSISGSKSNPVDNSSSSWDEEEFDGRHDGW
jgi:hypothetical protein